MVSVVVATYNMATYLPLAIESALSQTYRNIEVLVVDDGSTDGTRRIVEPLLEDRRLRYLFQQNAGQASAKNHGVRDARGEFIAFLDADDIWVHEKLAEQVPLFLKSAPVGVVFSRVAYIDAAGRDLGTADNELFRGRVSGPLLVRNFIGFGTSVVRRECFERMGGFDEGMRMGIDYDLWLRLSTRYEFDYVDRPFLKYRMWPGQMSGNCKGRYLSGIAIMERFLRQYPGAVDRRTVAEAWAHTFVGYGRCLHDVDRRVAPALRLYAQALRYKLNYLPAWKAISRVLLGLQ